MYLYVKLNRDANCFLLVESKDCINPASYEQRNMSARRGPHLVPIEIPTICWTFAAKKNRQENMVYQELKHLHEGIFRVIVFGVGVIKIIFFNMLKIETKTYQFCFELKHYGILNKKRLNIS